MIFEVFSVLTFYHFFAGNADIIAIQCINRSSEFDDFVMGLTYVTVCILFILRDSNLFVFYNPSSLISKTNILFLYVSKSMRVRFSNDLYKSIYNK